MPSLPRNADLNDWPEPPPEAVDISEQLVARIRARMDQRGGVIPFAEFMEMALYEPGMGYYSNGLRKFGAGGDFITAPELSPLFGQCIAAFVEAVLTRLGSGDVLEFGAGSGALAVQLLTELERRDGLPAHYYILERSGELQQRQREEIAAALPHLHEHVVWLDALPEGFRGVMLGNEVLDASPVQRVRWNPDGVETAWVAWRDGVFSDAWKISEDTGLNVFINDLAATHEWAPGYETEVDVTLKPWVTSVAEAMAQGALLLIDYGSPRAERYHPQRASGTLMCHYRHRAHGNPLILPGLQDITSYVDFTSVAEAGTGAGLTLEGFATQAHFLLDCGLDQLLAAQSPDMSPRYLTQVQQAKQLVMPGEMGERFKCMALRKDIEGGLPGFRMQDLRGRL